jgi:hypothetical protein
MEHHRLAVSAELDVELDSQARLDRGAKSGAAVFDPTLTVKPAMRERPGDQSFETSLPIRL